jgi:hypothetical protein
MIETKIAVVRIDLGSEAKSFTAGGSFGTAQIYLFFFYISSSR